MGLFFDRRGAAPEPETPTATQASKRASLLGTSELVSYIDNGLSEAGQVLNRVRRGESEADELRLHGETLRTLMIELANRF